MFDAFAWHTHNYCPLGFNWTLCVFLLLLFSLSFSRSMQYTLYSICLFNCNLFIKFLIWIWFHMKMGIYGYCLAIVGVKMTCDWRHTLSATWNRNNFKQNTIIHSPARCEQASATKTKIHCSEFNESTSSSSLIELRSDVNACIRKDFTCRLSCLFIYSFVCSQHHLKQ